MSMGRLELSNKLRRIAAWLRPDQLLLKQRFRKASLQVLVLILLVFFARSVPAGELTPVDARHFVIGRWWNFNCSEGTKGFGILVGDGSIHITIQEPRHSPVKHDLAAGTVSMTTASNCASAQVGPVTLRPCFSVDQINARSFRGRVASPFWMWALWGRRYCDFISLSPSIFGGANG